jgi:gamma-aminobutyrate permease
MTRAGEERLTRSHSAEIQPGPGGLGRTLASRHVAMISIGGIIGAGLFVGSSVAISAVGPAIIVSYILAGLMILCVMRMLGEMAAAHPHIGAFTEFAREGLGNWAGFVTGWLYWYFWVVVVAIEAIAGATLLKDWLPLDVWQIGLILMLLMTGANLLSTRSYGEFEFWFASLKVAAIVVFIVVALAFLVGFAPGRPGLTNLVAHGGFVPRGPMSIFSGVTTVIFALCGAEIATIAAAESAEPAKTIARMTSSVALRIILFYVLSMILILAIVPWDQVAPGTSPFATALERVGVPGAALIMKLIVLTAVLSCLNSGIYVTSRVLFTLAARGDAPQALVALNRRQVPARAILIGVVFGYGAVIASIVSPQMVFAFLVNASGATMLIIYLLTAAAQIRMRRALQASEPQRLVIKMWLFPWLSWAVIAAILAVLAAMLFDKDLAAQLYASLFSAGLAVLLYFLVRARMRRSLPAEQVHDPRAS